MTAHDGAAGHHNSRIDEEADRENAQLARTLGAGAETDSALRFVDISDLRTATLEPTRYAVHPIIPAGLLTLLGAHGGTGKSMFALILAAHFAASRPWGPFTVSGGAAVFVSLEDPANTVRWRLRKIVEEYGLNYETVIANLRIVDGSDGDGTLAYEEVNSGTRRLIETPNMQTLRELIGGAKLIVIDNASDGFDGNENDRRMVRTFVRMLAKIARANEAGLLLLAHIDKAAARNGSSGNSYSGSTAWNNSARSRLAMVAKKSGDIELAHEKHNLGKCAAPLTLSWSSSGVLIPSEAHTDEAAQGVSDITASADAQRLLDAMRAAQAADVNVPTARTGPSTAQAVLATFPELPAGLQGAKGRERFWAALAWLLRKGSVSSDEYTDDSRHKRRRFVVVDAAVTCARLSPIPPANERAQIARHAADCDSSENPAELSQTPARQSDSSEIENPADSKYAND